MKPTKKMRATSLAQNLLAHYTNSAIVGRNVLEDGEPKSGLSVDDIKTALGEHLKLIEQVNDLLIDEEAERDRQTQRKQARDAGRGMPGRPEPDLTVVEPDDANDS